MQLLGLRFEHRSLSVFRSFAQFQRINPLVKAPSLVCDDGEVLVDSTLILNYAEALAFPRSLMPTSPRELQRHFRVIGLALVACEKSVQIFYEKNLRPAEKLYEPWLTRVTNQLQAAYDLLEKELVHSSFAVTSAQIMQAGISTAVAWYFTQSMIPDVVPVSNYPSLAAYSERAETLPEFLAAPHGEGTYPA